MYGYTHKLCRCVYITNSCIKFTCNINTYGCNIVSHVVACTCGQSQRSNHNWLYSKEIPKTTQLYLLYKLTHFDVFVHISQLPFLHMVTVMSLLGHLLLFTCYRFTVHIRICTLVIILYYFYAHFYHYQLHHFCDVFLEVVIFFIYGGIN